VGVARRRLQGNDDPRRRVGALARGPRHPPAHNNAERTRPMLVEYVGYKIACRSSHCGPTRGERNLLSS
jgi:hypothetical protein